MEVKGETLSGKEKAFVERKRPVKHVIATREAWICSAGRVSSRNKVALRMYTNLLDEDKCDARMVLSASSRSIMLV